MVYAIATKRKIHADLMKALETEPQNLERFTAKMELQTGMTSQAISKIIHNLVVVGLIQVQDNEISKR